MMACRLLIAVILSTNTKCKKYGLGLVSQCFEAKSRSVFDAITKIYKSSDPMFSYALKILQHFETPILQFYDLSICSRASRKKDDFFPYKIRCQFEQCMEYCFKIFAGVDLYKNQTVSIWLKKITLWAWWHVLRQHNFKF